MSSIEVETYLELCARFTAACWYGHKFLNSFELVTLNKIITNSLILG